MRRSLGLGLALALFAPAFGAYAVGVTVEAGASFDLGDGRLDLGCSDLAVAGDFALGSGTVDQILDVTLSLGGTLDGANGTLNMTGNWNNAAGGTFIAGTSSVNFVDGCGVSAATITGNTTFSTLTITTTTGKSYQFEAGSTQTIGAVLSLSGAVGNLLVIGSTSPGNEAILNRQGIATVDFVQVQDLRAEANPIVFGPNSVVGPNTANVTQCGDIDGNFLIETADVMQAQAHLVGKPVVGDIALCNVLGPHDPLEGGADCSIVDVFVLERLAAGLSVTAENGCVP